MQEKTITVRFKELTFSELSPELQNLVNQAKAATEHAHAPYSNFCVGAAALTSNKRVITGSNQENMAYPSGICAERTLLFAAGHSLEKEEKIVALAIEAKRKGNAHFESNLCPCGGCLQVINEYINTQGVPFSILLPTEGDKYEMFDNAAHLLVKRFAL